MTPPIRLLIFLSFAVVSFVLPARAENAEKETTYERVMRTKILRCGYLQYEPFLIRDPNTGEISGVTVDYVNERAAKAGLKIEWAEDVNIDQIVPALEYGRIDAFCVPCTPDPNWEKRLGFSGALGALPYYTYVRKDSTLTQEQLGTASFAVIDGYALTEITRDHFPKARYVELPQTTSTADMYNQLRYRKADAHINESISAMNYIKNNPDVIRKFSDAPIVAMQMFLVAPKQDKKMQQLMTETFDIDSPNNLALMKSILTKYNIPSDAFYLTDQCSKSVNDKGWKICTPK